MEYTKWSIAIFINLFWFQVGGKIVIGKNVTYALESL